jgi:hypothetical protein
MDLYKSLFYYKTTKSEINLFLELIKKLTKLHDKIPSLFPEKIQSLIKKKLTDEKYDYIRFISCLDPNNQALLYKATGYKKHDLLKLYRAHIFFITFRNNMCKNMEILGIIKNNLNGDVISLYSELNEEEKSKIIDYCNKQNDEISKILS